jgi:quercetin dioxygenase-like cupin family protein/DNA-binding Xre family transcriptional regulator
MSTERDEVADAPHVEPSFIGKELRALRHQRGLGLAQVAEATNISKSFLSLVEVGKSDITFGRLMRLVTFYGISVTDLVPGQEDGGLVAVVRRGEQQTIESPAEGMRDVLLTPDTKRTMLPILAEFEPGAESFEPSVHDGEEFVYVLQGNFAVHFEGADSVVLDEGDSVYFAAELPHTYKNTADGQTRVLFVVSPPHI